jgi:anti-sigma factor RsiW
MSSLIQQLNNESILLMYLAEELPVSDRADVEQMLANDARLREELESLRAAYEGAHQALAQADQTERLALPVGTAARRVGLAARSWHVRRLSAPPAPKRRRAFQFPWWSYPLTSAVAMAVIAISWWMNRAERNPMFLPPVGAPQIVQSDDPATTTAPVELAETDDVPYLATVQDEHDAALDQVEEELLAMSQPGDDGSGMMLLLGESNAQ